MPGLPHVNAKEPPALLPNSAPAAGTLELMRRLAPNEVLIASLALDLDDDLHYASGVLAITPTRLLVQNPRDQRWSEYAINSNLTLDYGDHAGVATLELRDADCTLSRWHFTLQQHRAGRRLIEDFNRIRDGRLRDPSLETTCPTCGGPLAADGDECPTCVREVHTPPSTWTLLRLWRFARPYSRQLISGFLLTLAATAATLVPPYMTMPLMDKVLIPFGNGVPVRFDLVGRYLGGLLGAALLAWALGWARTYLLALVSERIGADLRTATFDHMLRLSLEYYGGKRTGDLMARLGSETDRICVFLSLHLLDFATDVLVILMTATILFVVNPWLALVTLLPLPIIAWMIHVVRDHLRHGFEKANRIWSEVTNVLADTIPGIRVVKAFAQEQRESVRFRDANRRNLAVNDRVNAVWSLFTPTVTLLTEVGLLVVWGFGIWQVSRHQITVGVLTAFLAYISRFYTRLDSMSRIVSVTQKAAAGAKRIFEVLDHVSSVPEPVDPVRIDALKGAIELSSVGCRYGNRAVLEGISLDIAPGEMIGLVGHSGSGKSTLVNLICRFYDVGEGAIKVDGVDIRALAVGDYRRNVGLVLQEPFLFFGTIADNIAYGKPDASRGACARIHSAAPAWYRASPEHLAPGQSPGRARSRPDRRSRWT